MSKPDPQTPPSSPDPEEPRLPSEMVDNSPLLRQVFFERYFRTAAILMLLCIVFMGLFLPKIYRCTPEGVIPQFKISGLDMLQAWSLARAARAKGAAGFRDEAYQAWGSAVRNNPGNPVYVEGMLTVLADHPTRPREPLGFAFWAAPWLLQLKGTNDASTELVSRLYTKFALDDYVIGLLSPRATNLTPNLAAYYLKSLFQQQRMDQFGEHWPRYSNILSGNVEMQVIRAAWQTAWGPPGQISQGRKDLEAFRANPATRDLAHRLSLHVAMSLNDSAAYERSLDALVDNHADRVIDHVLHWRLLLNTGQSEKASRLARGFSRPPETYQELREMVAAYSTMNFREEASRVLEQHLPTFAFRPELWEAQANLFITLQRWPELRELAVHLRQTQTLRENLAGYAWFLEGLSALKTDRREAALEAFTRAAEEPTTNPLLSFSVARQLTTLGYPILATRLLNRLEKTYGNQAQYWFAVVGAAYEARQFDTMREAAGRGYLLNTNEPIFISNYAAMLLMERTNAPLAAQLTLQALSSRPNDPGMQINHAQSLILNDRLEEAEELLGRIKVSDVESYLITERNFAYFDLYAKRRDKSKALAAYHGIEPRFLFLPQLRWLDRAYLDLTGEKRPAPSE